MRARRPELPGLEAHGPALAAPPPGPAGSLQRPRVQAPVGAGAGVQHLARDDFGVQWGGRGVSFHCNSVLSQTSTQPEPIQ
jgi:hypothetical protein